MLLLWNWKSISWLIVKLIIYLRSWFITSLLSFLSQRNTQTFSFIRETLELYWKPFTPIVLKKKRPCRVFYYNWLNTGDRISGYFFFHSLENSTDRLRWNGHCFTFWGTKWDFFCYILCYIDLYKWYRVTVVIFGYTCTDLKKWGRVAFFQNLNREVQQSGCALQQCCTLGGLLLQHADFEVPFLCHVD